MRRADLLRRWPVALVVAASGLAIVVHLPEALAFPHHRTIGDTDVYAEAPLSPAADRVLADAATRLSTAGIGGQGRQRLFLTGGGWRWRVLTLQAAGAFAISRPIGEPVVVNRSDLATDGVFNGRIVAGRRSLSGVIAHERVHGWIRARYGPFADLRYPEWLREGYADVVAGGGSLHDDTAAALRAREPDAPALRYYDARLRVAGALRANGGNVAALFAQNDRLRAVRALFAQNDRLRAVRIR